MSARLAQTRHVFGSAKRSALLLLLGACLDGNDARVCTLVGCDSGANLDVGTVAEADVARLTGARIKVCLNGMCRDRVIEAIPPPNDVIYLSLDAPMDPRIEVSLWRTDPSGAIEIEVGVRSDEWQAFHDGDVYSVALAGSDGGPLLDRSWSAVYQTTQPNGPRCGPTCRSMTSRTAL